MIGRIRHWRLLTLLLLLATPGLGGTALQALHPCPESMPWLGAGAAAAEDAHAAHAAHGPGGSHEESAPAHGDCQCVGACLSAVALAAALPALPTAVVALHEGPVRPAAPPAPVAQPLDRLPPSTAPPLV